MKSFDTSQDIKRIRLFFDLTQDEFSKAVNISKSNIIRYENNEILPHISNLENIYSYSYMNKLDLNLEKSRFFEEEKEGRILLFHGARNEIIGEVDNKHSIFPNDFGNGFYLGENLKQAATWISAIPNSSVYCFYFKDSSDLKFKKFTSSREWMYAILYYRGAFRNKDVPSEIKRLVNEIEQLDYLIAPIADNKMYEIFDMFMRGEITDEACLHALSLTDLGYQYVIKSNKAISRLTCIDRLYFCKDERAHYLSLKRKELEMIKNKVKISLQEYRRKGKYIDELFD